MRKLTFFIFSFFVLFSCKQNTNSVKSILKIHGIAIDGVAMNEETLKKGDSTIDYQNGSFELKVNAEVLNVKVFFSLGNSKREITKNVVDGVPFVVNTEKDVLCKINFEGDGVSLEYKFSIHKLSKEQNLAPNLKSLTVGDKKITEIKDEISVSFSSFSDRVPISWEVDKECKVSFLPELKEGMLDCSFDEDKVVFIKLKSDVEKTYKLTVRLTNANVTEDELYLTFLKVYGKEIKPIKDSNDFVISHDAPYNIPLEILANNGASIETEPAMKNGKIEVSFNKKETLVKITCKKEGFAPRTYFLNIEREEEKAGLRSLKVNGHLIEINDEMEVTTSYAKDKVLIEAVGKYGTSVSFNPSLDSENKIDLNKGQTKIIEMTVSKSGVSSHVYKLKLNRENDPASPRPSNVESIMIAVGHDAVRNFSEIDRDFPSNKESAKYEINRANEYTLRIEKLNVADVITVIGSDGKAIEVKKTDGLVSFYNITLKEVDTEKSSIEEIKIKIEEHNMQEKTVTCKMCFQGALAEAFKRPIAEIGSTKFEPLLTKINYLSEGGLLGLKLEAYDPLSTLTKEDGGDFPAYVNVGDDVVEIGFVLTTVTDKKIRNKVRFKKAVKEERTLLEYLKFYPKDPDLVNGVFAEYSKRLSPLFTSDIEQYNLELEAGDDKIFFDLKPIIKEADVKVYVGGELVNKEEYFRDLYGNKVELYSLEISPDETKILQLEVTSDSDSSIKKNYIVKVVSPDDGIVAKFDATFFDSNEKTLLTLPAIGKNRGIRLPPQDYDGSSIKFKLEAKAEGITFLAKQAVVKFNKEGKIEKYENERLVAIDSDNSASINTEIGMNYIVIQATARNGITKLTKIYEVYKFSKTNKIKFELTDGEKTKTIEPVQYQMIEDLSLKAPITFKGFAGDNAKFVIQAFQDYQAKNPFKVQRNSHTEFSIPQIPKIILLGVIMPDNAQLYYAIFFK